MKYKIVEIKGSVDTKRTNAEADFPAGAMIVDVSYTTSPDSSGRYPAIFMVLVPLN